MFVKVTSSSSPPPMPLRSYASKHPRKESSKAVTAIQHRFLEDFCALHEKQSGGEPRAKAVRQAMIKIYGRLAMDGNDVPIVMTETEIFNWLKRRWSTKKAALSTAAALAVIRSKEAAAQLQVNQDRDQDAGSSDGE